VVNMLPLVVLAGRNNPLISLLSISFDTYNVFHRWIGRITVALSVVHTIAWLIVRTAATGGGGVAYALTHDVFLIVGLVGVVTMILLVITTFSPLRHAFYETFLTSHIIMAILILGSALVHCWISNLPQLPVIQVVCVLYLVERLWRFGSTVCTTMRIRSPSDFRFAPCTVWELPGDACRVTIHLPRHQRLKPGMHAYLRIVGPKLRLWHCHPFSIAWAEEVPCRHSLPMSSASARQSQFSYEKETSSLSTVATSTTDVSFIIHAQTGFTRTLLQQSQLMNGKPLHVRASVEGPYGGHHSLDSYGHVVLYAGASGITHQLSYVRHLMEAHHQGTVATQRITLIWVVRDMDYLEWVRDWMDRVLAMTGRREVLRVKLFVTRPKNPGDVRSPSATVQMFPGRPDVDQLLGEEVADQHGAMAVTVCGPGSMADGVREAVRRRQYGSVIDLIEESFTW
jgi:predicted ferric reductase